MTKKMPDGLLQPPTIIMTEDHVREAIVEWCAARGRTIQIPTKVGCRHPVQWRLDNEGTPQEPDIHFAGAVVTLPMPEV